LKVRIITVGKISSWTNEGLKHYEKLLRRFARIEHIKLPTGGDLNKENFEVVKKKEGKKILQKIKGTPICFDINGKALSTSEFANFVDEVKQRDISIIIGGPAGLCGEVLKKCKYVLSLSNFTLSHEIALLVVLEQLFRAFKIVNKEKYDY